jgi:type VI secretion system protein ImpH
MTRVPQQTARTRQAAYETWLSAVAASPFRIDFYQALRRIASAHPDLPSLGQALRPKDEPLRLGQPPSLDFAPAALHSLDRVDGKAPRLSQRIFGLLGPNGALPLHLTEYTHERVAHHNDVTLQRFLDMLTHRFALLFYRAWAEAQPTVSLDRPGNKTTFNRVGALAGVGLPTLQDRDALPDASKLHFVGRLARQTRDAEGLLAWCRSEFGAPVAVEQWSGHWMQLAPAERSRLGRRSGAQLGRDMVIGAAVWDVQHKFRITVGPLSLEEYRRFLPGGMHLARLQAMVRHWVGLEFEWDLKLMLDRNEIPLSLLGTGGTTLGHTTWLGCSRRVRDPDDLCLDVERVATRHAARKRSMQREAHEVRRFQSEPAVRATQGEPA